MSTLTFFTPVTLEEPFIFTMGASVKTGDNPIGMFGTGLKYAIAVTLRNGGSIAIFTQDKQYSFFTDKETVRNQEIEFIKCNIFPRNSESCETIRCPMTTEYGKNWEPWMVMRELYSNTMDESGEVFDYDWNGGRDANTLMPRALPEQYTRIVVDCPAVFDAWLNKGQYLIDKRRTPVWSSSLLDVYNGSSNCGFYRGIRVAKFDLPSGMTYNVKMKTALTEDRTLDTFMFASRLRYALQDCEEENVIRPFLEAVCNADCFEHRIDWDYTELGHFKPIFRAIAKEMYKKYIAEASTTFKRMVHKHNVQENPVEVFSRCDVSEEVTNKFDECMKVLNDAGLEYTNTRFVYTRDIDCYAVVNTQHRIVFINPDRCFDTEDWKKQGCMTLIEEYVHLLQGSDDCTRMMQHDYNETIYKLISGKE